jgi:hypothetical protein
VSCALALSLLVAAAASLVSQEKIKKWLLPPDSRTVVPPGQQRSESSAACAARQPLWRLPIHPHRRCHARSGSSGVAGASVPIALVHTPWPTNAGWCATPRCLSHASHISPPSSVTSRAMTPPDVTVPSVVRHPYATGPVPHSNHTTNPYRFHGHFHFR